MSTDPLKCSLPALVDQADFTAQQLRTFARAPHIVAAFPRWFGSLEDRAQALHDLSDRCRDEQAAASYARGTVDVSYLQTKPALAAVQVWAAALRKALDAADGDPEGRRLAGQVRAALRGDLRWVAGTVAMLHRVLPLLDGLATDLAPWLDTAAEAEAARPHLATLVACQVARGKSSTASVGVTRKKSTADAELRTMMRRLRRDWGRAVILSRGRVPEMNLVYAASDVANQPAKRAARKAARAAKAEAEAQAAREGAPPVGESGTEDGNSTPADGDVTPEVGKGTPEVGNATTEDGKTTPEVGNTTPELGVVTTGPSRGANP
jgi:hypothetical protein